VSDLLSRPARSVPVVAVDLEMTGLDPTVDRVCEVAVLRGHGPEIVAEYQALVRPPVRMSAASAKMTGLTDALLAGAPAWSEVADTVAEMLDGAVFVSHNAPFDLGYLHREFDACKRPLPPPVHVDTLLMARRLFAFPRNNLQTVCEQLGVTAGVEHRAMADARATFLAWHRMLEILDPAGTLTIGELVDLLGALAPNSPLRLEQQRVLRDAHRHQKTVFIEYQSTEVPSKGVIRREIGIWHLKLPYIQAWCYLREGERVFRLDRIITVKPADREYDIPKFDPRF
jgi:DNA polymerase III subunit epsilon